MQAFLRAVLMIPKPSVSPRAVLVASAIFASPALAQTAPVKTFDLEQVSLSPGGQHSLLLSTGDILAKGELRLSLAAQYQRNPLVFVRSDVRQGAVIGRRFSSHLGVAYGLTDDVELALQLPVILTQKGDNLTSEGISPVSGTVLGAPLLQGRFVLARQSPTALGDIGLNLALSLPIGSSSGLSQDPGAGIAFNAGLGFGHDFGSLIRLGAEAGAVVRRRERLSNYTPRIIDQVGSYFTLGATASTLGEGLRGEVTARALIAATQTMSAGEVMAGARYPLPSNLEVFALAGPGIGKMPGNPSFRAFAGISYRPFPQERAKEQPPVPRQVEPAPALVCPPAPPAPQCPPPPPPPPPDSDRDGIPDAEDACPNQPGDAAHKGCPPPPSPPPPEEPKKPKLAELKGNRIEIRDQVRFATSKSQILAESFPLLDDVARILKEHPELTRLEISGHTDSRGAREYNIQLSQDRAEAVRRYLVEKGVESSRLVAKGYGPDQPIDTNDTAEGRQKNRRTEFHSVSE
jgi:outer membrane protein OmpA-like peptidoglycan-associated protein